MSKAFLIVFMAAISAFRSRFFARRSSSQKELHSSRAAVRSKQQMRFFDSNERAKEKEPREK